MLDLKRSVNISKTLKKSKIVFSHHNSMKEHISNRRSIGKVMSVEIKQHTSEKNNGSKKKYSGGKKLKILTQIKMRK